MAEQDTIANENIMSARFPSFGVYYQAAITKPSA
jgi:hypothetical protein